MTSSTRSSQWAWPRHDRPARPAFQFRAPVPGGSVRSRRRHDPWSPPFYRAISALNTLSVDKLGVDVGEAASRTWLRSFVITAIGGLALARIITTTTGVTTSPPGTSRSHNAEAVE